MNHKSGGHWCNFTNTSVWRQRQTKKVMKKIHAYAICSSFSFTKIFRSHRNCQQLNSRLFWNVYAWCLSMGNLFEKLKNHIKRSHNINRKYFLSQFQLNGKRMLNAKHSDHKLLYSKKDLSPKKSDHVFSFYNTFYTYCPIFQPQWNCFMWKSDHFHTANKYIEYRNCNTFERCATYQNS